MGAKLAINEEAYNEQGKGPAAMPKKVRHYYLDHLRVFLTVILLLHHTAIAYSGAGSWYYVETDEMNITSALFTVFTAVNQAYFLGLFFFLSGYFTPGSYFRKGSQAFIKDRLLRLGIPLAVYVFIIGPTLIYFLRFSKSESFGDYYLHYVKSMDWNWGPAWFIETLLIFTAGYVIWKKMQGDTRNRKAAFPTHLKLLASALVLGAVSIVVRLFYPVGEDVMGMQLGYYGSYIFLFAMGTVAYENNWLDQLTKKMSKVWFTVSIISIPLLPVGFILAGALDGKDINYSGGLNPAAIGYALWEPFVCIGLCMAFLMGFRKYVNGTGKLWNAMDKSAFTVYLIHPPIIVALSLLIKDVELGQFVKFLIVGGAGTILCFALANGIRKLPLANKIL